MYVKNSLSNSLKADYIVKIISHILSLSVRACDLEPADYVQLSLLPDVQKLQKQESLEAAMDKLRNRFGYFSVQKGLMLTDRELSNLDAKNDHIIHPMSFFS